MKSVFFSMAFVCTLLFNYHTTAQCIQSGPFNATVFSNNTAAGSVTWNTPGNAALSDDSRAQATQVLSLFATANTNYLVVQGLGFNIPVAATICGISISIERNAGGLSLGGSVQDAAVRIIKNGSITGTNHASPSAWGSSDATATYGSSADVWGTSWTPADINAGDFGVAIAASLSAGLVSVSLSARIDHVTITVFYLNPSLLPVRPERLTAQAVPVVPAIGFYPNPANNTIYITGRRKSALISIKDLEGRLIRLFNIHPSLRLPQVSLAGMKPGLYLLEIDGEVFRLRVE